MFLPPDSIDEGLVFSGCYVHSFFWTDRITTISHKRSLDETYIKYSVALTDDMTRFWRSRSQQVSEVAKASMSTLVEVHVLVVNMHHYSTDVPRAVAVRLLLMFNLILTIIACYSARS